MKPKHTPGPWIYQDDTIYTLNGARHVCSMAKRTAFSIEGETGRANARLIAAAPEMFACLEECEWALRVAAGDSKIVAHVAAVIAKARGGV